MANSGAPLAADTKKSPGKSDSLKAGVEPDEKAAEKKPKTHKMAIISRLSKRTKVCATRLGVFSKHLFNSLHTVFPLLSAYLIIFAILVAALFGEIQYNCLLYTSPSPRDS